MSKQSLALDSDFKEDTRLFHYTNADGLRGIFDSNCLWATHFRFLNDSKEFIAARGSLEKFLQKEIRRVMAARRANAGSQYPKDFDPDKESQKESTRLAGIFYEALLGDERGIGVPYVFSTFACDSDHEDFAEGALLHWAVYGRGGGYALQLDPHKILRLLQEEHSRFNAVFAYASRRAVYGSSEDAPEELIQEYQKLADIAKLAAENNFFGITHTPEEMKDFIEPILKITSVFKDRYFQAERESRLVIHRPNHLRDGVKNFDVFIRSGGSAFVPYIKVFQDILLGQHCPIERIIVSPHSDNERRMMALRTYLRGKGLGEKIQVTESKVPYVGGSV